jgi:hypothetical protein
MKAILIHQNEDDPVSIGLSDDMLFHIIYQDRSISTHRSLRLAINQATNEFVSESSMGLMGWQAANT